MEKINVLIEYLVAHPVIMGSTIVILTIVVSPITWLVLKLFLYLYRNHIKIWKENWLIRKELTKEFYKHVYSNWRECPWPHISDPILKMQLKDKGIEEAHELHIGTKIVITMGKNGAVPIEYVYCWGLEIQDKVSFRTLSKCWRFCYNNVDRAVQTTVISNSYLNMGIHYIDGIGVKVNYKKAIKYFTLHILNGGDPDSALDTLNKGIPMAVVWDPIRKKIIEID
jgi:hypothetical protein